MILPKLFDLCELPFPCLLNDHCNYLSPRTAVAIKWATVFEALSMGPGIKLVLSMAAWGLLRPAFRELGTLKTTVIHERHSMGMTAGAQGKQLAIQRIMARSGRETSKASFRRERWWGHWCLCAPLGSTALWWPRGKLQLSKPSVNWDPTCHALFRALIVLMDTYVSNQYFITNSLICVYISLQVTYIRSYTVATWS